MSLDTVLIKLIAWLVSFSKKKAGYFASSTAFFFFISMIPICIFATALLPLTGISEDTFVEIITKLTPNVVDSIVSSVLHDAFNMVGSVLPLSVLALLWAAGKGVMALIQGLNVIFEIDEHRNYFHLVFVSVFYTIVILVSILISMVVLIFGQSLRILVKGNFPGVKILNLILSNSRYAWFIGFGVLVFCFIYTFLPAQRQKFKEQIPGALFSGVAWTVFSIVFSYIIGHGSIYSTYYGGLASIVIFLLWLYGIFYILLIGAYINVCLNELKFKN